ncbi:helix-turn-helix transcriptional regulator [Gallibacterium genomosp. 3]|uniref:helix-turn-helix transcriptional regulator n=1 Tax=Gallibacterium genomosp. 3 TaxID=505345 RepID=UPI0008025F8E|nr:PAS domain-containing protein [Gallibacterium genomosp. 3]
MIKVSRKIPTLLNYPLTDVERLILRNYEPVLEMLSNFLGTECEAVLHSLEDLQHSVIKISNSHLTGRQVGAPITDTALRMLKQIEEGHTVVSSAYFTHSKTGKRMRSITQAIYGEHNRIIGLLCVNLNLDMSLTDFFQFLFNATSDLKQDTQGEHFAENADDLLQQISHQVITEVDSDPTISVANRNKQIVFLLNQKGVFELKGAIKRVAELLGISIHTVYMHLRNHPK